MSFLKRFLNLTLIIAAFSACDLIEPQRVIYGKWQAEHLSIAGIGLPISPMIEFRPKEMVIGDSPSEVQNYVKKENTITVTLKSGVTVNFTVVDHNTLTVDAPILGKVTYTRMP